ncbi:hypothetical protein [Devosia sp. Root685]|uniref:hypothetical protein n=1 Tax=Devosia sp. Root685 TaxID=1736587 RepID=UPI0006FF49E9|nr:hypothetical protein [Devosia sp. Root685]
MPAKPSNPGRAGKSEGQYQREAIRLLNRAKKLFPDLPPVEALIVEASSSPTIKWSTLRRYKPSYHRALIAAGSFSPEADFARLCRGLTERGGQPLEPQTSSNKVTDATRDEAAATFQYLKRLVLKRKGRSAMAAGLYVLVAPRIGMRPVELLDAVVTEEMVHIKTAKRRNGKFYRSLRLTRFSPTFIEALKWLCVLAQDETTAAPSAAPEERFESWRNAVAEALARASKAAASRRLSLYSFRHVSLATWKANGFSAADIALMAGHLDLRGAGHYASGRHGWRDETALVSPLMPSPSEERAAPLFPSIRQTRSDLASPSAGEDVSRTLADATEPAAQSGVGVAQIDFVYEDFPTPGAKPAVVPSGIDARAIFEARADEIEANVDRLVRNQRHRNKESRSGLPRKR